MSETQLTFGSEQIQKPWKNEQLMRSLYEKEDMTMAETAEELGCSRTTISMWLDRFGVEKPDHARRARQSHIGKPVPTTVNDYGYPAWRHGHAGERWMVFIHKLAAVAWFGFDEVVGNTIHHKNHIPWDNREGNLELMPRPEHTSLHASQQGDGPWQDEQQLRDALQEMSPTEVADEFGCSITTIRKWAGRFDIQY